MNNRKYRALFALLAGLFVVSACAEAELAVHTAKQVERQMPKYHSKGQYKVGNPYQIQGVWYYPKVDYGYSETGIASWYGPGFHGRRTANGEVYNQNAITAAHRTLPMPSMVRVTNLENGRSIKVRINDRGPFANNRIIDLSRKSASLLGVIRSGTAKVKVELIEDESRRLAALSQGRDVASSAPQAVPLEAVTAQSLPAPGSDSGAVLPEMPLGSPGTQSAARNVEMPEADGRIQRQPVDNAEIYVQAGSFVMLHNALRLKAQLSGLGLATVSEGKVGDTSYFRVRLGPLASVAEGDHMLRTLIANGFTDSRLVVN